MDNMKNNKMTPGPWRTSNHDTLKDVIHVEAGPEGYERETVCICCGKNSAKNSKAIAALPELVNVALELVEYGQQTGWGDLALCGSGDKSIDDKAESIMRNARLALEKAGVL